MPIIVPILLTAGASLVQTALPVRDHVLITEEASLGLALAVVGLTMSKKQ